MRIDFTHTFPSRIIFKIYQWTGLKSIGNIFGWYEEKNGRAASIVICKPFMESPVSLQKTKIYISD